MLSNLIEHEIYLENVFVLEIEMSRELVKVPGNLQEPGLELFGIKSLPPSPYL